MKVSQERTLEGRLFQIAGAAEQKPRAPNEMLQRITDRRFAEADSAWSVPLDQTSQKYGGLPIYRALCIQCIAWSGHAQLTKVRSMCS